MNKIDRDLLKDMLEFGKRIQRRVTDKTRDDLLLDDEALGGTLIREISVIAEAANHLSVEFVAQHPELEIPAIVSMRNRIIHGYRSVNWNVVWTTSVDSIPVLVNHLERILSEQPE